MWRLATIGVVATLAFVSGGMPAAQDSTKPVDGSSSGLGAPMIRFTSVPDYGAEEDLRGVVLNVRPSDYAVTVLIRVQGGWWTKPYFDTPVVRINADGTWTCDVTTGGMDGAATQIVAFLVPATYIPPPATGTPSIPASVIQAALARIDVTRSAKVRTVAFAGFEWRVKTSWGIGVEPGPNAFSDDPDNVWVDAAGRMHLKITHRDATWQCAEIVLTRALGHGRYVFTLAEGFENLNDHAVLGLFTWDTSAPELNNREIDIEFSRWSKPGNQNGQFVVQPSTTAGNLARFDFPAVPTSVHTFTWTPSAVQFQSGPLSGPLIASWSYHGPNVPTAGNENVRLNLWLFNGTPPSDGREMEVVVKSFEFDGDGGR